MRSQLASRWLFLILLGIAFEAFGLAAPSVRADGHDSASDPDTAARSAFEAGRHAYDRGRFDEALVLYEHAYALTRRPKMLFNIGRAAEADDQGARAIEAYEAYLATDSGVENREFVLGRLRVLRGRTTPPGAVSASTTAVAPQVLSALSSEQGPLELALQASPLPTVAAAVPVEADAPIAANFASLPVHDDASVSRPFWKRVWFWSVVGAVVVGGATAAVIASTLRREPARAASDVYVLTPEIQ